MNNTDNDRFLPAVRRHFESRQRLTPVFGGVAGGANQDGASKVGRDSISRTKVT